MSNLLVEKQTCSLTEKRISSYFDNLTDECIGIIVSYLDNVNENLIKVLRPDFNYGKLEYIGNIILNNKYPEFTEIFAFINTRSHIYSVFYINKIFISIIENGEYLNVINSIKYSNKLYLSRVEDSLGLTDKLYYMLIKIHHESFYKYIKCENVYSMKELYNSLSDLKSNHIILYDSLLNPFKFNEIYDYYRLLECDLYQSYRIIIL